MKKVRRVRGATPDKKVVKRPDKNKFVLRTAARRVRLGVLAFCKGRPQGAACKVRPAGSFSAMRKRREGLGRRPKRKTRGILFYFLSSKSLVVGIKCFTISLNAFFSKVLRWGIRSLWSLFRRLKCVVGAGSSVDFPLSQEICWLG